MIKPKRTVFVSGSSRGIGLEIAKAFAYRGDNVVLNGRSSKKTLEKAVDSLRQTNPNVHGIFADLSDYKSAAEVFSQIYKIFGPIEILVNNAGKAHLGLFSDMKPNDWEDIISNNLITAINMSHLAIPNMVRVKQGCIINISSVWGIAGASCEAVYSASKSALNAFTKSLAKELGPSGVRINAIACGAIDTRMNVCLSIEEKEAFIETIPLGRFGNPSEVGELAFFLASDNASYLTGQIINLDGGLI